MNHEIKETILTARGSSGKRKGKGKSGCYLWTVASSSFPRGDSYKRRLVGNRSLTAPVTPEGRENGKLGNPRQQRLGTRPLSEPWSCGRQRDSREQSKAVRQVQEVTGRKAQGTEQQTAAG